MKIFQLQADERLSKAYTKKDDRLDVTPYPMVRDFTSHEHVVTDISQFHDLLLATAADPTRCLLKGQLLKTLVSQSRAGSTAAGRETHWLCLDFDYADITSQDDVEEILSRIGLGDISYVLQYGAGHNITKPYSAHLYFLLDAPVRPSQLKLWLKNANFAADLLRESFNLTKTNSSLLWPLDVSLAQNDKLIYTAPPECIGFPDPVGQRVFLHARRNACAKLSAHINSLSPEATKSLEDDMVKELRKVKGLPKKTFRTKVMGTTRVLSNPDQCTVTDVKNERGFTYINVNGGDSWGYYFPQENPEVVFNFKGEPNYLLRDLDVEFYRDYKNVLLETQQGDSESIPFAFLDRATDKYYRGCFHSASQRLEVYQTDSLRKITDFAKQSGLFLGDYIEEWDYQFVFDSDVVFDRQKKFANRFSRTEFLREPLGTTPPPEDIPPTIRKVLSSIVGDDMECLIHLINWLACIVQHRQRTQTAWVFTGREGTGKGVFFNYILSPIIGEAHCKTTRLGTLEEDFNGFMEECVVLMIDESKTSQVRNQEKVMALLRNVIVEPTIQIRKMRTDAYMVPNYLNVIIASNHPDAIHIPASDRRYNVGHYQAKKLHLTSDDILRIQEELWDFTRVLRMMNADQEKAKTPLDNEPRRKMMYLTETSISVATQAIYDGNLEFFLDMLPTDQFASGGFDPVQQSITERFIEVLREAETFARKKEPHRLTRDQCQVLMKYVVEDVPKSPNKFTNFMKHYNLFFERNRKNGALVQSVDIEWQIPEISVDDYLQQTESRLRALK